MKTKILATIGPKNKTTENPLFTELIKEGVDIVRRNFSHCTYDEYRVTQKLIAQASKKLKKEITLMADLQGPRIRVGKLPEAGVAMVKGETYAFAFNAPYAAKERVVPIDDAELHADMKKGDPFFLVNGEIELEVTDVKQKRIIARVVAGGTLFSNKGINVPQTNLARGGLTAKDIRDAKFAITEGADYIALSFVQTAADVEKLRKLIGGKKDIKIISKIERAIALDNIDEIIRASDGIIVARGDLGIEIPMEELPIVQKNLVRHAHWYNKPAIVATQMLASMVENPRPTRAEVSDIANAVFEGADAVWLSDETAAGKYPVEAVRVMRRVAERAEDYMEMENFLDLRPIRERENTTA